VGFILEQIKRTEEAERRLAPPVKRNYEMLTADEELQLATAWRDHGDIDARNWLIEFHFPLAGKIMRKYGGAAVPLGWQVARPKYDRATAYEARNDGGHPAYDIGQAALIGLIEAANRFDPTLGNRFSTYAQFWVRKEINEYIANLKKLGVDKNGSGKLSLNAPIEDGEGGSAEFIDLIESESGGFVEEGKISRPQEDNLIKREDDEIRRNAIATVLAELSDRDREIFEARWLADDRITLKDLAAKFGVSIKTIKVRSDRALEMVKKKVASYVLKTRESLYIISR
jgi:RNA polymerase sigma-32 factor